MKKLVHWLIAGAICLAALPQNLLSQNATGVVFIQNDLETAKNLAKNSQKNILLKFGAKYCLPCRIMDESIWPNPDLAELVEKNCVAVAADIQTIDGKMLEQQYSVAVLPTILLLDADGNLLFRQEGSCGSKVLMDLVSSNFAPPSSPRFVENFSEDFPSPARFVYFNFEKPRVEIPIFLANDWQFGEDFLIDIHEKLYPTVYFFEEKNELLAAEFLPEH
jgi:thiol-disulfide isomerase/thioredoxin